MEDNNINLKEAVPGTTGLDTAAWAIVSGALGLAGKKLFDKLSPKKRAEATKKKLEKVMQPFDDKIDTIKGKIEDLEEAITDANEAKAATDDPAKKEKFKKKIEQLKPQLEKFQSAQRVVKEKKRKAKDKLLGPALKSMAKKAKKESTMIEREIKICSILLGENFNQQFLENDNNILSCKPSEIKQAYKKFLLSLEEAKEIPNYRKSDLNESCETCENFNGENYCEKYDTVVESDYVCDSYKASINENRAVVYNPKLIKLFIKQVEKKFPKYKGEIQQAEKDEIVFPNDPKLIKFFKGAREVKFVLSDSVEEAVKFWTVTITKKAGKLFKGQTVDVKARNSAEAIKKGIKQMKGNPALVPGDSVDAVLGESKNLSFAEYSESTAAYAKSLEKIANDRKMKNISKKDKETLLKIAALMAKEK